MWSLQTAKRLIVVAGCLAAAYTQFSISPATVAFARSLGATSLHIGILGALPTGVLFMQLLAALLVNHLHYRKPLWFWMTIAQRLVLVPAALGPWLYPDVSAAVWVVLLIASSTLNHAMMHFTTPLWLSWMGDYLPHVGLNRFWGGRELWMQWTAALSVLASSLLFYKSGLDIRAAFALLIMTGAVCGVCDILLFTRIEEPAVHRMETPRFADVVLGPFRQRDFRSFIWFSCFFNVAAMVGAPFISLFLLDYVGMDLFHVLLLWTFSWVGGAIFSQRLGILTERFGQRPMLILCVAFKSTNMLALLLIPPDPTIAFAVLIPVFMFDSILNSGILIANNGFMIKNSPRANRAMFIAAGNAFAGMAGGATSILTGWFLIKWEDWAWTWQGTTYINFHAVFAASLVLRLVAAVLARSLHEPASHGTRQVIAELVNGTPLRRLRLRRMFRCRTERATRK